MEVPTGETELEASERLEKLRARMERDSASESADWSHALTYTEKMQACIPSNEELASLIMRSSMTRSASPSGKEPEEPPNFHRLVIDPKISDCPSPEVSDVCTLLLAALALRDKYLFVPDNEAGSFCSTYPSKQPPVDHSKFVVEGNDGVFRVFADADAVERGEELYPFPSFGEYAKDMYQMLRIASYGPCKTFCFKRLELLEAKFRFHVSLNAAKENEEQKTVPHRDFYNVRKVDVHVHQSSCMNQKHLLSFIKQKLNDCPDEKVIFRDGKELTLREVFESLNLTAYELSVDTLDVHAHNDTFHRFDKFNLKYNPCGQSRLREIFLKTNNYINGRYLAELTREVLDQLEDLKYQLAEPRISIYGRSIHEWDKLADWLLDNNLLSTNVRWMIQTPRLFSVYKEAGTPGVDSFHDMIHNIFAPLFDATLRPDANPKLAELLKHIVAFDSVDDESKPERLIQKGIPSPANWKTSKNPPFPYQMFYTYCNLSRLNSLRQAMGLNTFAFRPHCGEAGGTDHMASSFLVASSINHGIMLRKSPVLQYLYYLAKVGLAMSPLSNNALFLSYSANPFYNFFERGLNVTLSTDDPLQFHYSKEPLIEEYSVAKAVWKLTSSDLSEIAKNSVLQSNYEHVYKEQWLGPDYWKDGVAGNTIARSNVPQIRAAYRAETHAKETNLLQKAAAHTHGMEELMAKLFRF